MKRGVTGAIAVIVVSMFAASNLFAAGSSVAMGNKYKQAGTSTAAEEKAEAPQAEKEPTPEKHKVKASDFPEKGWHKGPYLAANVGMMQATNDTHVVTGTKFDGSFDVNFGLTFGWDIADWIGPMMQINFATATGTVGNGGAAVGGYPAGTFPTENARQYSLDFSLFAKATLPYFTRADWQWKNLKIIPYAKLGGTGHAMYVNAPTSANKIGAYGGGPAVGLGCEFFIWKGLFLAIDATENLIIQGSYYRTISGINTKVLNGGFKPQFVLAGLFGWHF